MKYKRLGMMIILVLGLSYCTPKDKCIGIHQNPAICRGTFPPSPLHR